MTLGQLIKKAEGLKDEAFKNRVIIKRSRENYDPEIVSVDLNKILQGEVEDIKLVRQDTILVKSYTELREKRTITIDGSINKAGIYPFTDNLSVVEAIMMAGGFSDGAEASNIEIARRIKEDTFGLSKEQSIKILNIKVNKDLSLNNEDSKFVLHPFDKIYVRKLSHYEEQKNVTITGEVFYPGPYALKDKTERVSDLLDKAGGLKSEADLSGIKFIRGGKPIGIDLTQIQKDKNNVNNILLASGDALDIPRKKETVTILGQVYNPLTVPYNSKLKLGDYINLAGGTTDSAFVRKTYVRYANGNLDRTHSFFGIKIYPKIENGSEIYVPVRRRIRWTPAERIAVSSALVSIATIMVTIIRIF
jgi:protein involved in polysaccharide export with SLBB domain